MKTTTSRAVAAALFGLLGLAEARAQSAPEPTPLPTTREDWAEAMRKLPKPGHGCYGAEFPNLEWHAEPCKVAPARPYRPSFRTQGFSIGNGQDASASTKTLISTAIGRFLKLVNVTSERDGGANVYSLQINSQFFTSPACKNISGCQAWEQFVYSSSAGQIFIQYWLLGYNTDGVTCPTAAWISDGYGDCYINSVSVDVNNGAAIPVTDLASVILYGSAKANLHDSISLNYRGVMKTVVAPWTVTYLANSWNAAEFNIFGDGGGSEATFNAGAQLTVDLALVDGATTPPACLGDGTTGETNNMNFVATPVATRSGAVPQITFIERVGASSSVQPCSAVTTVGK